MNEDIRRFFRDRKENTAVIVIAVILFVGILWYLLRTGNGEIYHDTDNTVGRIEERINGIEHRLNIMQERIAESQKTVHTITERVVTSGKLAEEINSGLGDAEQRIDDAIQRGGRIKNLIDDIERANR